MVFGAQDIIIDGHSGGKVFYGIGAISGGGGNSRFIKDYPVAQRDQIMDYLFKPNFGASLQILKVEVGGDMDSSSGAEPSILHTRSETPDFNRGYSPWMIGQAKNRNPAIKYNCLAWGAPGWIGNKHYWSTDMMNYYITYIKGMQSLYGITFDAVGTKNESGYDTNWIINFKAALKTAGLSTKIVASDNVDGWAICKDMANNPALMDAIDIVSSHIGDGIAAPTADLINCRDTHGKPVWSSEAHFNDGGQQGNPSAAKVMQELNGNYIADKITASIEWCIMAACYENMPYWKIGFITAEQPWTGYYKVNAALWAMAHSTQFIKPGWQYLDSGCFFFNGDKKFRSGDIVCAKSGSDWSAIVDMTGASAAQTLNVTVTNLSTGIVHVWMSNFKSTNSSDWFIQQADIVPRGGKFTLIAQPGCAYSLTTTTGQAKGSASCGMAAADLPLPYADNYSSYIVGQQPRYLSDMYGAFEIVKSTFGSQAGSNVLRQMCPQDAMTIYGYGHPWTQIGALTWRNYQVSCRALMETNQAVHLFGRLAGKVQAQGCMYAGYGYCFRVNPDGNWSLLKIGNKDAETILASGSVGNLGTGVWIDVSLSMNETTISSAVNGTTVATVNDSTYFQGLAGLGTQGWHCAQFANLNITPTSGAANGVETPR